MSDREQMGDLTAAWAALSDAEAKLEAAKHSIRGMSADMNIDCPMKWWLTSRHLPQT